MNEFCKVCEKRKLCVNIGKRKITRCKRYVNVGLMDVKLKGKPLEELDCFKYLALQVAADGLSNVGHKMDEGYKARGALKNVLPNKGMRINAKCLYEGVFVPAPLYGGRGMG